ncbi:MAG: hypothetical protein AAGI01_11545, partial [Myxococcota bacterium]
MTTLDRFESLFRSAAKQTYVYTPVPLERAILITDLETREHAEALLADVASGFHEFDAVSWTALIAGDYADPGELLEQITKSAPHLVGTYRNLFTRARNWPYSLGSYVDVLAQVTPMPLLLLPNPTRDGHFDPPLARAKRILVITDHMCGSRELVTWGAQMTPDAGKLFLAHVEDDATFARYAETIGKLPGIDTESALGALQEKLLGDAAGYIERARQGLLDAERDVEVISEVRMGHQVADVRALLDEHDIDLVVCNVKDDEQLAMHGLS